MLFATGCAGSEAGSSSDTSEVGKYQQTWPRSYAATTCRSWSTEMDDQQRFVASADMLVGARTKDGIDRLPEDAQVEQMEGDITTVCTAEPTATITELAVAIYLADRPAYR